MQSIVLGSDGTTFLRSYHNRDYSNPGVLTLIGNVLVGHIQGDFWQDPANGSEYFYSLGDVNGTLPAKGAAYVENRVTYDYDLQPGVTILAARSGTEFPYRMVVSDSQRAIGIKVVPDAGQRTLWEVYLDGTNTLSTVPGTATGLTDLNRGADVEAMRIAIRDGGAGTKGIYTVDTDALSEEYLGGDDDSDLLHDGVLGRSGGLTLSYAPLDGSEPIERTYLVEDLVGRPAVDGEPGVVAIGYSGADLWVLVLTEGLEEVIYSALKETRRAFA